MIVFRVDGNEKIGIGHVMRNLSIANAFRNAGEQCCFLIADDGLFDLINSRNHDVEVLGTHFEHMDGEIGRFRAVVHDKNVRAVFVDSYYVTDYYLKTLHDFCKGIGITLVYIDDILAFPYSCDVLINYNIYASEADYQELYRGHDTPKFMLGTSYAPLRAEFQNLPSRVIMKNVKEILVSTGGTDFEHISMELIKTIARHGEWDEYRFHFVIGSMNDDKDMIELLAREHENIKLHENVEKMSVLMQSCDMAVSAAGSTLYELCACGVPTVMYVLADNQMLGAEAFERTGVMISIGDIRGERMKAVDRMVKTILGLAENFEGRKTMSRRMRKLVDGHGAERLVREMLKE